MYIITNYEKLYKPTNSKGGELINAFFVKLPVKPRGKGLRSLLKYKNGIEIFGIWSLLLQAATETTKPELRGKLLNHKDQPATIGEIAESISLDGRESKVENAIKVLVSLEWIESVGGTEEVRSESVDSTEEVYPKINKDKQSKEKEKHLDFVLLTPDEFQKLNTEYGEIVVKDYIQKLNNYIGSKGTKYKSHYFTIRNWLRRDGVLPKEQTKVKCKMCAKPATIFMNTGKYCSKQCRKKDLGY